MSDRPRVTLPHLPDVFRLELYAQTMNVCEETVYRQIAAGICEVPPALVKPYRWLRVDLESYLSTVSLVDSRKRHARRMRLVKSS